MVLIAIVCVDLLIVLAILAIRLINSRSASNLAQDTSSQVSPGIVVSGSVRTPDGLAVENVAIYVKFTNNPPKLIATTNAAGNYRSKYY